MLGAGRWGEGAIGQTQEPLGCHGGNVQALLLFEAQESLEWTLLEGEGGRKVGREDTHRTAGRRESPEAVNPAGRIVFINDTLKSNRCNKNTVAFSLNTPQRPLVQQPCQSDMDHCLSPNPP